MLSSVGISVGVGVGGASRVGSLSVTAEGVQLANRIQISAKLSRKVFIVICPGVNWDRLIDCYLSFD